MTNHTQTDRKASILRVPVGVATRCRRVMDGKEKIFCSVSSNKSDQVDKILELQEFLHMLGPHLLRSYMHDEDQYLLNEVRRWIYLQVEFLCLYGSRHYLARWAESCLINCVDAMSFEQLNIDGSSLDKDNITEKDKKSAFFALKLSAKASYFLQHVPLKSMIGGLESVKS